MLVIYTSRGDYGQARTGKEISQTCAWSSKSRASGDGGQSSIPISSPALARAIVLVRGPMPQACNFRVTSPTVWGCSYRHRIQAGVLTCWSPVSMHSEEWQQQFTCRTRKFEQLTRLFHGFRFTCSSSGRTLIAERREHSPNSGLTGEALQAGRRARALTAAAL